MGQCDAAEEGAVPTEQEVMVMMQQMAAAAWPQQDPAPQYAETDITIGHGHPDMQKLLDTTELARNQLMTNNYVTTMVQQNSSSVLAQLHLARLEDGRRLGRASFHLVIGHGN